LAGRFGLPFGLAEEYGRVLLGGSALFTLAPAANPGEGR